MNEKQKLKSSTEDSILRELRIENLELKIEN